MPTVTLDREAGKVCLSLLGVLDYTSTHGVSIICPVTNKDIEVSDIGNPSVGKMCTFFGYIYITYFNQSKIRILDEKTLELVCEVDQESIIVDYVNPALEKK